LTTAIGAEAAVSRIEGRVERLEAHLNPQTSRRHVLVADSDEDSEACIRRQGYDPDDERHFYFVILGA
jgi:hypothetical protein